MDKNIMTLKDLEGNEVDFELLDIIEYKEKIYTVFYPTKEDDTEVLILRVEQSENPEESLYVVEEDQKLVRKIYNEFKRKYKKEIDFKN